MRNLLKRHYGQGNLHFLTFSCYRRLPFFATSRARNVFVNYLDRVRKKKKFLLLGFVVMPEHVHLLVSEPQEGDLSTALQVLKQKVARILLKKPKKMETAQLKLGFAGSDGERHLWQRRFYDFNVWSEFKFQEKLKYMHANPVKRRLVLHPKYWPWSSWPHYANEDGGLIRIDQLAASGERNLNRNVKTRTLDEPKAKSAAPQPCPE